MRRATPRPGTTTGARRGGPVYSASVGRPWRRFFRRAGADSAAHADGPPSDDVDDTDGERGGAEPDHVLVFLHVPKCGGTTVHEWLESVLAPGMMSPERLRMPAELPAERARSLGTHRVFSGHFDVVDVSHLPTPQHRFTVLRDPVDRIVSLYDFWRAHRPEHIERHDLVGPRLARSMSFDEFARAADPRIVHDLDNTYVRTFTGLIRTSDPIDDPDTSLERAVGFVDSLDHVGHLELLPETFAWLCGDLGLDPESAPTADARRNVRGEWTEPHLEPVDRTVPSESALADLEPLVALDRELISRSRR